MLWDGRMDADKAERWTQTNRKKESNSLDRETQFTAPFECYEIKKNTNLFRQRLYFHQPV